MINEFIDAVIERLRTVGWRADGRPSRHGPQCLLRTMTTVRDSGKFFGLAVESTVYYRLTALVPAGIAAFNDSQTSVEPVIALLERVKDPQ